MSEKPTPPSGSLRNDNAALRAIPGPNPPWDVGAAAADPAAAMRPPMPGMGANAGAGAGAEASAELMYIGACAIWCMLLIGAGAAQAIIGIYLAARVTFRDIKQNRNSSGHKNDIKLYHTEVKKFPVPKESSCRMFFIIGRG